MGNRGIIAACRWLRQKLDGIERRAQRRDGAQREPQVAHDLTVGDYFPVNGNVQAALKGEVRYAVTNAVSAAYFEEYDRSLRGAQQGQLTAQPLLGRQVIGHSIPPYENQQASLTRGSPPDKPSKRRRAA